MSKSNVKHPHFSQIKIYRLQDIYPEIEDQLLKAHFIPPEPGQWSRSGFIPINPEILGDRYQITIDKISYMRLQTEQKILTEAMIKDLIVENLLSRSSITGLSSKTDTYNTLSKEKKAQLKERVIIKHLPDAFSETFITEGVMDIQSKLLFVNTANASRADMFVNSLRNAVSDLGEFHAFRPTTVVPLHEFMRDVVLNGQSEDEKFEVGFSCVICEDSKNGQVIRISNGDVSSGQVVQHLNARMKVTQLNMVWKDLVEFTLTEDFDLKSIKFRDNPGKDVSWDSVLYDRSIFLSLLIEDIVALSGGWKQL